MFYLSVIAILAAADLLLKQWVEGQDAADFPKPLAGTEDRIWLHQFHNAGFPFGFMEKYPELVRAVPLAVTSALGGVLAALSQKKGEFLRKLSLATIIGGSVSNLIDRYRQGYVTDYFSVRLGALKKVILNLGDLFIFLGTLLLLLWHLAREAGVFLAAMKAKKASAG